MDFSEHIQYPIIKLTAVGTLWAVGETAPKGTPDITPMVFFGHPVQDWASLAAGISATVIVLDWLYKRFLRPFMISRGMIRSKHYMVDSTDAVDLDEAPKEK